MVGLIEHLDNKMTLDFKAAGDIIFLVGTSRSDINSSEYLHKIMGVEYSPAPHFDLEEEYTVQQKVAALIKQKLVNSAHDCSEGGLLIALLESSFNRNLGFDVSAADASIRKDGYWLGEAQSRVVVSVSADNVAAFKALMGNHPYEQLGTVTNGAISVNAEHWGSINDWKTKYDTAIEKLLQS